MNRQLEFVLFFTINVRSLDIILPAREIDFSGVQSLKSHKEVNTNSLLNALIMHL